MEILVLSPNTELDDAHALRKEAVTHPQQLDQIHHWLQTVNAHLVNLSTVLQQGTALRSIDGTPLWVPGNALDQQLGMIKRYLSTVQQGLQSAQLQMQQKKNLALGTAPPAGTPPAPPLGAPAISPHGTQLG
jgi:hypothetical protein